MEDKLNKSINEEAGLNTEEEAVEPIDYVKVFSKSEKSSHFEVKRVDFLSAFALSMQACMGMGIYILPYSCTYISLLFGCVLNIFTRFLLSTF